ncbi:2TM domain-containing protein [Flavobacterium adhaerens]|uniref:2TM domain-containing protein n=1 Tax=Flavobacterium adhaerens TaxID=3149043 RepID=UPI0032B37275
MENFETEEERYARAKARVAEIKRFYHKVKSFLVISVILITVNLVTSPNRLWFYWPVFWLGAILAYKGLKTFGYFPFLNKEWEQKKLNEFLEEEKNKKQKWD